MSGKDNPIIAPRPNILWYCSDQQRWDTIRALGNGHINTPRIDEFLDSAVAFTHAFSQSPICTPSRSSFLTGMYASYLRANRNGNAEFPGEGTERLITRRLKEVGYDCGLAGKLHLTGGYDGHELRTDDGYSFFHWSHSPRRDRVTYADYSRWLESKGHDPQEVLKRYDFERYPRPKNDMPQGGLLEPTEDFDNVPPDLHQTTWCTEMAMEFLDKSQAEGKPWLMSVNPFDPHECFDAPWEFYRRYEPNNMPEPAFRPNDLVHQAKLQAAGVDFQGEARHPEDWWFPEVTASYYAMIELVDEQFGRILDHLESTGQRDNTIVIFMSDHGEMLGDHGLVLKGCRFYEGAVRVPLAISWPGHFEQGLISDALVELIDVYPTILEAVGEVVPDGTQGKSLIPILTGSVLPDDHRDFVWSEYIDSINRPDGTRAFMYRDRRWKLITYHGNGISELYDLKADPNEFEDLWDDPRYVNIKADLLSRSFDALVMRMDTGPERVTPY